MAHTDKNKQVAERSYLAGYMNFEMLMQTSPWGKAQSLPHKVKQCFCRQENDNSKEESSSYFTMHAHL